MTAAHFGYLGKTGSAVANLPGWLVVIDFLRGYDYSRTAGWWYLAAGLVSVVFWIALISPIMFRASWQRRLAIIFAVLVLASVSYLAFRSTEFEGSNGEIYEFHRFSGFVTHLTIDSNHDGQIDDEYWYTWREPLIDALHSRPQRSRSDKNLDGLWDTWINYSTSELRIDTDGDEIADITLSADHEGLMQAMRIRGY